MLKKSLRIIGFIIGIFTFLLILQFNVSVEKETPFNTKSKFELLLPEHGVSKEQVINELNQLSDRHDVVLIKTTADVERYEKKRDVIWFGSKKPVSTKPLLNGNNITWLEGDLTGDLVHSSEIGKRNLSGEYFCTFNQNFFEDLMNWRQKTGVTVKIKEDVPIIKEIGTKVYGFIFLNGIGNGVVTSGILLITLVLIWMVTNAKGRTIRFLGGISKRKINFEDTKYLSLQAIFGIIIAFIAILIYLMYKKGWHVLKILIPKLFIGCIVLELCISFCIWSLLFLGSPKIIYITDRDLPMRKYQRISDTNKIIAILMALVVLPTTINGFFLSNLMTQEYKLWANRSEYVGVSFNELDTLITEDMLPKTEKFFKDLQAENNLTISYVLDSGVKLSKDILGKYDHIIITDTKWVNSGEIGIKEKKENGELIPINYKDIPNQTKEFLDEQMPLLTKSKEPNPNGLNFYEFKGEYFPALPIEAGHGSKTVQAKNPLIILADNPVNVFKIKGFLLYIASSGNVIFSNEAELRNAIEKSEIKPYISSIDSISEGSLNMAQQYKQQAVAYGVSAISVMISMILLGVLNGKIWADQNRKRIFTLHTFGASYKNIISTPLKIDIINAFVIVTVSIVLNRFLHPTDAWSIITSAIIIFCFLVLGNLFAYKHYARKSFLEVIHRI